MEMKCAIKTFEGQLITSVKELQEQRDRILKLEIRITDNSVSYIKKLDVEIVSIGETVKLIPCLESDYYDSEIEISLDNFIMDYNMNNSEYLYDIFSLSENNPDFKEKCINSYAEEHNSKNICSTIIILTEDNINNHPEKYYNTLDILGHISYDFRYVRNKKDKIKKFMNRLTAYTDELITLSRKLSPDKKSIIEPSYKYTSSVGMFDILNDSLYFFNKFVKSDSHDVNYIITVNKGEDTIKNLD